MSSPRVSIIICSIDESKFKACVEMFGRLLGDVPNEIIGIHDARGLAEAYNRGIDRSRGEVLIFSHDDIEIITPDFANRLLLRLEKFDLLGLVGTTRLCDVEWAAAGPPYLLGQITQPDPQHGFVVSIFNAPNRVVGGIQVIDGLFMAINRRVTQRVRFDETFDHFHFYDLDFSASAHAAGFAIGVVNDIHAIHQSRGNRGAEWQREANKFRAKWASKFVQMPFRPRGNAAVAVRTKQEILEIVTPPYWSPD